METAAEDERSANLDNLAIRKIFADLEGRFVLKIEILAGLRQRLEIKPALVFNLSTLF